MKKLLPITLGLVTILLIAPMAFAGSTPKDLKQFTASPTVTITDVANDGSYAQTNALWSNAEFTATNCNLYQASSCGYAQIGKKFYVVTSRWVATSIGKSGVTIAVVHGHKTPTPAVGETMTVYY